jgi:hypothetical protein
MTRHAFALAGALCLLSSATYGLAFEFTYTDKNKGFNDPKFGAERRAALERGAEILGSSAFAAYDTVITVEVDGSESSELLASAGSNGPETADGVGSFGKQMAVRVKILQGVDINGDDFDASVSWNFEEFDWQLDIDTPPSEDEYDFYSTLYHELTHALGWAESLDFPRGRDAFGYGVELPGEWNAYDEFITDRDGIPIIDPQTYLNDDPRLFRDLARGGTEDGLFFNGENAVAANDGFPVPLYTPNAFETGSSIAHLDDNAPELEGFMMLSASDPGPTSRVYSDVTLGILQDLGYEDVQQIER